jgi:uncharacterized coiled-coil protein SlyX
MARNIDYLPRIAIFLAGVAAGALTSARRERGRTGTDPAAIEELKRTLAGLETRLAAQDLAASTRFVNLEARLEEHATRLGEIPSAAQIVGAMEQMLSKTMASLDDRLTAQAHSIDALKTTVSQTDALLERVLESLDTLQTYSGQVAASDDAVLARPAL